MTLLLILFVVWIGLCLLLGAGAIFLQGYLNETPPDPREIAIRAPMAGAAVAVVLSFWCFLGTLNPPRWAPLTDFSTRDDQDPYKEMKAVVHRKERNVVVGEQSDMFFLRHDPSGKVVYRDKRGRELPRADEIIVVEDGAEAKFLPDRDAKGEFKFEKGHGLRYVDSKGRVMEEPYLGQVTIRRTGWFFTYLLINLFHGGVWLVAVWLLMRFSFWQAFGIAVVAWGTTTLFVLPPLLKQAQVIHDRREREAKQSQTARLEKENRRESLATLPPVLRVRSDHPVKRPAFPGGLPARSGRLTYLDATEAGNSIFTFTS